MNTVTGYIERAAELLSQAHDELTAGKPSGQSSSGLPHGFFRTKKAEQLKPRDVVLGQEGHKVYPQPLTVFGEVKTGTAGQVVVPCQGRSTPVYISPGARLIVVTEW